MAKATMDLLLMTSLMTFADHVDNGAVLFFAVAAAAGDNHENMMRRIT